jgi:exosortase/archaeosortase family protein
MERLLTRPFWFVAAQLLAFWPVWRWYAARLTTGSGEERWGLVALVAAAALTLPARTRPCGAPPAPADRTFRLWLPTLLTLVYVAAYFGLPPIFRAAIAITSVAYTVCLCGERRLQPGAVGLLMLALPVLPSFQFVFGYPLRVAVGFMATPMLNLMGLAVARDGATFIWNGQQVAIDAPCSGVRMLWAALFLTFALCAFHRLGWARTGIATALAVVAVLLGNTLRAAALFIVEAGILKLPSWSHEGTGLVVFAAVAVGLVLGVRQIRGVYACAR